MDSSPASPPLHPRTSWSNIPAEMRALPQWVYATLVPLPGNKVDKAPRDPNTWNGGPVLASVDDPSTWGTFEQASRAAAHVGGAVGFVLTATDPFVVIDLDRKEVLSEEATARQDRIYYMFDSYAERSQSGKGVHIILRGKIGGGLNRDHVEVYDQERYIVFTGDVARPGEIREYPEELAALVEQMGGIRETAVADLTPGEPETRSDDEVLERMFRQRRDWDEDETTGDKLRRWHEEGPRAGEDWSSCDLAYLNAAIFASGGSWEQALRLFEGSAMWRGEGSAIKKAGVSDGSYVASYLMKFTLPEALGKYRKHKMAKDGDIEHGRQLAQGLIEQLRAQQDETVEFEEDAPDFRGDLDQHPMPELLAIPGLAGALAHHRFTTNAEYDSPTASFMGAVLGLSSIIGLSFQGQFESGFERTDFSMLYGSLLGDTGIGKTDAEGLAKEIIAYAARQKTDRAFLPVRFRDEVPSGQSIHTTVSDSPHQALIFIDELGLLLQGQGEHTKSAYRAIVKLHGKTFLSAKDYADKDRKKDDVDGVSLNFGSSTTGSTFLKAVEDQEVTDGFLSRLIWFIVTGAPDLRPARSIKQAPWSPWILKGMDRLISWCVNNAVARDNGHGPHVVKIRREAEDLYESADGTSGIRPWAYHKMTNSGSAGVLYNRVPRNTKSLALVLAVSEAAMLPQGQNPDEIYIESRHLWTAFLIVGKGVEHAVRLIAPAMQPNDASRLHEAIKKAIRQHTSRTSGRAPYKEVSQTVRQNSTNKQLRANDIKAALDHLRDTGEILIERPKRGMLLAVLK